VSKEKRMKKRLLAICLGLFLIPSASRVLIHGQYGLDYLRSYGQRFGLVALIIIGIYLIVYGVTGRRLMDIISPRSKEADDSSRPAEDFMPIDQSTRVPSQVGIVHVNFEPADVLKEPGFSESVERVGQSTDLRVLTETADYLQVETPTGKKGWISKKWVDEGLKSKQAK
jgi:hypothetical protein